MNTTHLALCLLGGLLMGTAVAKDPLPDWEMGPFVKLDKPVLSPNPEAKFPCPVSGREIRWEEQNVYNPAAVVKDGKVWLLYRADDKCWWKFNNQDQATSRIGLAWSEDGRRFTRHPTPVVFPDMDEHTKYEWPGGCQDVHVVEGEDGTYYMNYTAWGEGGMDSMGIAISKDLIHWQKRGPAFAKLAPGAIGGSRSGVVVTRQVREKLLPVKANGQYLMYYTHPSSLAVSDNLIDWKPLGKSVWGGDHESGAIALWRDDGILLMFNKQYRGVPSLPDGSWALGQALIDRINLVTVRQSIDRPFLQPEFDWEMKGYCPVPAIVSNSLVYFKGEWLLYYGGADRHIGLAVYRPKNEVAAAAVVDKPPPTAFKPAIAQLALDRGCAQPGQTIQATYTFRSSGPSGADMQVFVHVVRPDGRHIGADFMPKLATTAWPAEQFVREGPFPIEVPADAAPGKYQVWVGMFPPDGGGERVELANPDRERGKREYLAGEFEVVAAVAAPEPKPAVFDLLPVDEANVAKAPPPQPGMVTLKRVILSVEPKVLNPIRQPDVTGKVTLTALYSDESQRAIPASEAVITARTRSASGNVQVVAIDGDKVVGKAGGVATVEASVALGGRTFKAAADVVVTPYYRDYHQTLVLKLFMGMEGDPVERLANDPTFKPGHEVFCTFEEALEVFRRADNITRGIPKIVYLVGWQKGGHDHGYPAWSEVNPRLKRAQDATALDSLRWLIREARRYNTTVSLHINMADAYRQSPVWDEYVARDCISRDESGKLYSGGIQVKGEEMYNVVYPKEWEAGLAQKRIDGLIAMIPELKEGHTIHVDVFIANRDGGKPLSAWHAKPENGGLTPEKYVETQRKIFHYWRDRGFDVTGEGTGWAHPPGEHFIGLQPMSWWYSWDPMSIPECLGARGRTDRGGDGDFRFGSSMHGEEIWKEDKVNMPGFLGMFCRTTLPWYYLSRHDRQRFQNETVYYSDGVTAGTENGHRIIRKGPFILRDNDDLFVPALWHEKEIIAYSRDGYPNKSWRMPEEWKDIHGVDLYRITLEGCVPLKQRVPVTDGKLTLSLEKHQAISIVPENATVIQPK